ncbi:MAG: hypothetical protein E7102_01095 [Prevotella ruminicola]|jgi:hypothetical protein|uniref:Uncharacterized protein n=1 Tax=Xylanibacter ruminicola TaxID=839 RepID=A0A928BR25_XYLRU|nr:hypothetical protein [Xylanibacter ruminicola]
MNEDRITTPIVLDEEVGYLMVCESVPVRDLNTLLEDLHVAFGSGFVYTLKQITLHNEFKQLEGETEIYAVGGENSEDFANLLNAARKAVEHGYRVYILPNPKNIRTADFIFERKGVYRLYDLKTIQGKASAGNRMNDSIGQTNRVLLNISTDYNSRLLASDIKTYFENNSNAVEVLIFKGKKVISVVRDHTLSPMYNRLFRRKYEK